MQVPETDVTWTYSLLNASESKASSRIATPADKAAELVGIDGTNNGGLKPFPGFRELHRFNPGAANGWTGEGGNPYTPGGVSNAHRCRVVDFWSFSVIAGTSTRVFGFVYVVRRASNITTPACNNVYDILMEYYAPQSGTPAWTTIILAEAVADGGILAQPGTTSAANAVMSLETTGRAVYLFRRGSVPICVYFKFSGGTTTAERITSAGPGKRPNAVLYATDFGAASTHDPADFPDPTNSSNPPGSVVFSKVASPFTVNGTPPVNMTTGVELTEGAYTLAVQFEDSRSGRKSQITSSVDLTFTGSVRKVMIDGTFDKSRFDTLNIYRSVRTENAAGVYTGGILQLDAQVTLEGSPDYTVASLPGSGPISAAGNIDLFRYVYQLKDASLVMQDVFLDKPSYSPTMPKGGAGAMLDGTMLVGNISDSTTDLTGTGETRWSASGEESPELFTAKGIYKPSNIGDAVTCFKRTGQIMAGFTRNGVQIFSKENGFVRVLAAHQGYGVTGPYAACTVGPISYYLNYRGLKSLYPDARLDDVQAINQLVSDDWFSDTTGAQELSKVSMAFDPPTLCMYVLNPTRNQAVQMWFATGIVSELQDMSFDKVTQGWWQDSDGQLVPRAMFLFNAPYPDAVTNTSFRPAVFMPSRTYDDKVYNPSKPTVCMLDMSVNRCPASTFVANEDGSGNQLTITQYDSTCTQRTIEVIQIASSVFDPVVATNFRLIGMWVYQLLPIGSSVAVKKGRIVNATTTLITIENTGIDAGAGITLVLDPVYVKWVGAPMRLSEAKDEDFIVRQPTSMGAVFSEYEVATQSPSSKYWVGGLYRNEDHTPLISYVPTKPDGTVVTNSIQVGDTPNWVAFGKHSYLGQWFFPSFETYLPNVKYRLVGVQVKGRMLPTDRTKRTY